jgi:hypothetical protein
MESAHLHSAELSGEKGLWLHARAPSYREPPYFDDYQKYTSRYEKNESRLFSDRNPSIEVLAIPKEGCEHDWYDLTTSPFQPWPLTSHATSKIHVHTITELLTA